MTATHRIEHHALSELVQRAWGETPRRHKLEEIRASVTRFGYARPLVIDDTSGRVVVGNGLLAALLIARQDDQAAPQRVTVREDGEWTVPTVHIALQEGEWKAYSISDTRTEELGEWDSERLIHELQQIAESDLGLDGIGFTNEDLEVLLAQQGGALPESFAEIPSADGAPDSKPRSVTCPHCGETFEP
ncbi:hypothetical protein [Deinococcus sp. Marseille-Q6407]|uniref:hypothetical protein n=1 Tax=Deinococcus sp. Marseille-Q6407 TaxID=2969223 RepID=UPI0021C05867|nr:hypothetical protein [Deinococcus sp. Marseille-Q6407]